MGQVFCSLWHIITLFVLNAFTDVYISASVDVLPKIVGGKICAGRRMFSQLARAIDSMEINVSCCLAIEYGCSMETGRCEDQDHRLSFDNAVQIPGACFLDHMQVGRLTNLGALDCEVGELSRTSPCKCQKWGPQRPENPKLLRPRV